MRRLLLALPLLLTLSACIDAPKGQKQPPSRAQTKVLTPRPEIRQCLAQLSAQQAIFTRVEDQYFSNLCSTVGTVKLAALSTDNSTVEISNLGPVTCATAEPFAAWARFSVDRAAQQILGTHLVKIETFGSYACRNIAGTSRRSGHATANAIDVSGFVLGDGRRLTILKDWNGGTTAEKTFLRTIHASACKRFGTTLGPAYNMAHADHLHIEADSSSFCR